MLRHMSCGVVVQSSDSRVAVVDAFLRNEVLAGVYGEKDFLVDFGTPVLRNLLGYDGIHVFSFLMVGNEEGDPKVNYIF